MNRHIAHIALTVALCSMFLGVALASQAQPGCTLSGVAGEYGYTSSGTIAAPPVGPFGTVGRVTLTDSGTFSGAQTTSIAGNIFEETVQGTYTVNSDCTGAAIVYIYHGPTLARTTELRLVWDEDEQEMRAIPTSDTAISLAARKELPDEED